MARLTATQTDSVDYVAAAGKLKSDHPWIAKQYQDYLKLKPQQAEMQRQLAGLVADIRKAAQPKPHTFIICP